MKKINSFVSGATATLVVLIVISTYELKNYLPKLHNLVPEWSTYLIAILLTFLGGMGTAKYLTYLISRYPFIRKIICGDGWIEGYWILFTEPNELNKEQHFLVRPAIMLVEHKTKSFDIKTVTYRLNSSNRLDSNESEVAYQRENSENPKYLHYFTGNSQGKNYEGVAKGEINKPRKGRPWLKGKLYLENIGITWAQSGFMISDYQLNKLRIKYGNDDYNWIQKLLECNCNIDICLDPTI